jgi:hypothetical protein
MQHERDRGCTREMQILAKRFGLVWVIAMDKYEEARIDSYWNFVRHGVRSQDFSDLREEFDGEGVGLYEFETDSNEINYWARRGRLVFEDI